MKIKGIKYVAPFLDNSGYGKAARGNILALHGQGVPLTLKQVSFETVRPDLGSDGKIINELINKDIDYNVVFIHTTPEFWSKHREPEHVNVGFTIWETSKLHPDWSVYINDNVQKVLVGCSWNEELFRESGVTIPIGVVPHGINMESFNEVKPFKIAGVKDNTYMFYDIFQWVERKNPLALIKAYWYAFKEEDNVALVLKTYRGNYHESEKEAIRSTIKRLKMVTPMAYHPPIHLIPNMLSESEMLGLHMRGDCYVSLDRGEGFGLSPFTAGTCGNPIIVTNYGGSKEYAKDDNSYLVDYTLTPVYGMPWCGSPIMTISCEHEVKLLKDMTGHELVFNKNGNLKEVIKIESRILNDDEEMLRFKVYSSPLELEITNKHKLYVATGNNITKKEATDIGVGDYLVVPKPKLTTNVDRVDLIIQVESVYRKTDPTKAFFNYLNLSEDLFYLIGLYLAEGYVNQHDYYVSFSFNINEKETLGKRCKEIIQNVFGLHEAYIYDRDIIDRNGYEITFNSTTIAYFFRQHCGTGSHSKYLNSFWWSHPNDDFRKALLRGYWDGDGHIRKEGYKNKKTGKKRISPECIVDTASKGLCLSIRNILLSLNIVPSININEREDGRIVYTTSISNKLFDSIFGIEANRISSRFSYKVDDDNFAVMVTKKEIMKNYDDFVYSMAVKPDKDEDWSGSYILNGIASSNSPWYRGDQLWAETDVLHGAKLMRKAYENQEESKDRGQKLKKYISENFTWEIIGKKIIKEIEKI